MSDFVVSAIKYRPTTFTEVVGQDHIANTLERAVNDQHLPQALLFTGPRGVGKTTCARILAKRINGSEAQAEDQNFSYNIFELDAASNNSVENIRELIDQVRIPPQVGRYKIYIIDEAHMLSQAAFNAFLKTLEEPPKHAIFILATTEKHKIISTILSRCQIFEFKRVSIQTIKEQLHKVAKAEGVDADDDTLHLIAKTSDGGMRDALFTFDKVVSFCGNKLDRKQVAETLDIVDIDYFFETIELAINNDIPKLLTLFHNVLLKGYDGQNFISELGGHLRNLLLSQSGQHIALIEDIGADAKRYQKQASKTPVDFLVRGIELTSHCDLNYRLSKNPRLLCELCLMQLASLDRFNTPEKPYINEPDPSASNNSTNTPPPINNVPTQNTNQAISTNTQVIAEPLETLQSLPTPTEPKQQIKETLTQETKKAIATTKYAAPIKPEVSENSADIIQLQTISSNDKSFASALSLRSVKHKDKPAQPIVKEEKTNEKQPLPFEQNMLQTLWTTFAQKKRAEKNTAIASQLSTDKPYIKQGTVYYKVSNQATKRSLEEIKYALSNFLAQDQKDIKIPIVFIVDEQQQTVKIPFSNQEKLERLQTINPEIKKMIEGFALNF